MVSGPSGFMHRPTSIRSRAIVRSALLVLPGTHHQQPSSNTRHKRRKDHKERLKGKSSLGTAFRSPCLSTAPCPTGNPSDWSLVEGNCVVSCGRRELGGRGAIDCIYANTFLCVKINIFMHVILHVIVSYHLSFGFEIYYLHTRGSTALVEVNNYIMNR